MYISRWCRQILLIAALAGATGGENTVTSRSESVRLVRSGDGVGTPEDGCSVDFLPFAVEQKIKRQKTRKRRLFWISGSLISVTLSIVLISFLYSFRSSPTSAHVHLNQVITEDSKHMATSRVTLSLLAPENLSEPQPAHTCTGEFIFPGLEDSLERAEPVIAQISRMGGSGTFSTFIKKMELIVNLFREEAMCAQRSHYSTGLLTFLNKALSEHMIFDPVGSLYQVFVENPSNGKTYALNHSENPVLQDSAIVNTTESMEHVSRIFHVFNYGVDGNVRSPSNSTDFHWYLQESLNSFTVEMDISLDDIRTLARHLVLGLTELHKVGMGHSEFSDVGLVGYSTWRDDEGDVFKTYKIVEIDAPRPAGRDPIVDSKIYLGQTLLGINQQLQGLSSLTAALEGHGDMTSYAFYGEIGNSLECVDFILWCLESPGTPEEAGNRSGNVLTWDNVLEKHPFLNGTKLSSRQRTEGRLKYVRTFWDEPDAV